MEMLRGKGHTNLEKVKFKKSQIRQKVIEGLPHGAAGVRSFVRAYCSFRNTALRTYRQYQSGPIPGARAL